MAKEQIAVEVIVSGQPVSLDANLEAPLRSLVERALTSTGNGGQPPDNWEFRNQAGDLLDMGSKLGALGLASGARLFLNLKAGVGG
jgi:Protein of Unknown function (DUF2604)